MSRDIYDRADLDRMWEREDLENQETKWFLIIIFSIVGAAIALVHMFIFLVNADWMVQVTVGTVIALLTLIIFVQGRMAGVRRRTNRR